MTLSATQRAFIFLILALVMAGTRINHFAAIPDASWAVFFVAGFYLRGSWRWAFALLIAIAVLVDPSGHPIGLYSRTPLPAKPAKAKP